jgi:cytochrome oxidase Cu insertion factor (SCO1/SenC/PrrC family)
MSIFTKKNFLPFVSLLFLLALTACAGSLSSAEDSLPALPGETLAAESAQPFTLPSGLEGDVSLASYAGEKNVVLVFYRGFW